MRMRIASAAIVICLVVSLSFAGLVAPPLTAPAQAAAIETITLVIQAEDIQQGNSRPLSLQPGDEIIQFTRDNLFVGSNPSAFLSEIKVDGPVTGDLTGTMSHDLQTLSVSWDELPPGTAKGYYVQTFMFDDGAGNTFGGIVLSDFDQIMSPDIIESSTGRVVSTSGTGIFSGQKLIGTVSSIPGGGMMTLRRYSSSDISGPSPFSYSGTLTGFPECIRTFGSSDANLPNDEFVQFTRPNIVIPASSTGLTYQEGHTSTGTATGALSGTITQTMNSLQIPVGQGWVGGKFDYSDGGGTMSGVFVADTLGGNPVVQSTGYMFALYDAGTTTGAYAGKDYFATFSSLFDGSSGPPYVTSGAGDLYTLAEGAGPSPTPTPAETITLVIQAQDIQSGNSRPLSLQPGDEIIQFTRDNLFVGSNPSAFLSEIKVDGPVTGDLTGTMSHDLQTLSVSWDELPPGTVKGYYVQTFMFDDGAGNTFGGIVLSDFDQIMSPEIIEFSTGRVVSTSGTGTFSGQKLIGTVSSIPGGGMMTLRRYSSSEVSGPTAFGMTGTVTPGNARPVGPSGGPQPNDEFLQVTRSNIVVPEGEPAIYQEGMYVTGSCSGALTGTMPHVVNSVELSGTNPIYQGWSVAKLSYSDGSGTMNYIAVSDSLGDGQSQGYMFATAETGITGTYAGKEYFTTFTAAGAGGGGSPITYTLNGSLYALTQTASDTNAPAAVADLSVVDVSTSTITLEWPAPGDDGNAGIASQYDIRMSESPIAAGNWDLATPLVPAPAPSAAGSVEALLVTGLSESTAYYFGIITADEVLNWSGLSNIAIGMTAASTSGSVEDPQHQTELIGDFTIDFESVTGSGETSVILSEENPGLPPPPDYQVGQEFSNISTTATYSGIVTVCLPYDESQYQNEDDLLLYHYNTITLEWEEVTISIDTDANTICGEVTSLSWFYIGGQWVWITTSAPVFPSLIIGIAVAFGAAFVAYILRRRWIAYGAE